MSYKIISAEEAASHIHNGDNVGFSGFTAAGSPKAVSEALAKKAIEKHEKGIPFQVGVFRSIHFGPSGRRSGPRQSHKVPYAVPVEQRPAQRPEQR